MRLVAAAALGGMALLGMVATSVWAQGLPIPTVVQVETPDGGLSVTLGAQRVAVEATGPDGDPVTVLGSVTATLAPESIAALGPQPETLQSSDWIGISSLAAEPVPADLPDGGPGAMEGRSEIRIVNASFSPTGEVVCDPPTADGGLPEWGVRGTPLFSSGGNATWTARDNVRIYCRARVGTNTPVAPLEKRQ